MNSPLFMKTRMFIAMFTRACHWSSSWVNWIHSSPWHSVRQDQL